MENNIPTYENPVGGQIQDFITFVPRWVLLENIFCSSKNKFGSVSSKSRSITKTTKTYQVRVGR